MKAAEKIRNALNQGQIKDYTYAVLFFLVSAFFIGFVIRPVLTIAISLQKESKELEEINKTYEENISHVLKLQSELEKVRDRKPLLSEALPEKAGVKQLIDDVQKAAQEQGIQVEKVIVNGIYLKEPPVVDQPVLQPEGPKPATQVVNMQLTLTGSYDQTNKFMAALLNQRRIKSIESFSAQNIEHLTKGTVTGLQLSLQIESYYL